MGLSPPSDKELSYDPVKHTKGDNTQTFSLFLLFCVDRLTTVTSAIPLTHFIDFTWRNDQVFCSLRRDKGHTLLKESTKDEFATPMKSTDKLPVVMSQQASTYEFWYLCYFQNPSFHTDH